jgi:hypothetical protein
MRIIIIVIITGLFFSYCTKESPTGSSKKPIIWEDTVGLYIDSVTVNHQRTDTLSLAYDDTTCDSLAVVRVYLSRYPEYKINSLCNMIFFDNFDNNRFECYTCKQLPLCDSIYSIGYLSMNETTGIDTVIQASTSASDTFFRKETTAVITIRVIQLETLGKDTGRASIHLESLYNREITDTTELDTSFNLYWNEI